MNAQKKSRLEALRAEFEVTEKNGAESLYDALSETIADHINNKHGREIVVRRKPITSSEARGS